MQHTHAITPLRFSHLNSTWTEVQLMTLHWAILSVLRVRKGVALCSDGAIRAHFM